MIYCDIAYFQVLYNTYIKNIKKFVDSFKSLCVDFNPFDYLNLLLLYAIRFMIHERHF